MLFEEGVKISPVLSGHFRCLADIPLGKFGVALDIEIFVDDQGNFNKKGWDFDSAESAVESVLRKIYYLRYGRPGESIFVKVGALDNVALGYGLTASIAGGGSSDP